MISREDCLLRDTQDELAGLREEFSVADGVIYLDGNSLGPPPRSAMARAREIIEAEWGADLIQSWNKAGWFDLPVTLGDQLAPLIGADRGEVVVTDSTSINLFKALAAALRIQARAGASPERKVIVTERGNFPTDIYIAEGLTEWLNQGYQLRLVDAPGELQAAIDEDTAVVMLTHVNYRTGRLLDMNALTAHAHAQGALIIWDLAHSAGALPLDLNAAQADFAVGCTYKYLNGGPGSPAYIWVPGKHQPEFAQPLSGWWGHAEPFAMRFDFEASRSIRSALCGTQPILSLALVRCGLDVFAKTDMSALRNKSLALTDLFIALVEQRCSEHGLLLITPNLHAHRGSQVSFAHPHAYAIIQALIGKGVVGDYRDPGIMRFGFAPAYIRYIDVWNCVDKLALILDHETYDPGLRPQAVT